MKNKKVNNNVTIETRVTACVGSINFRDFTKDDLPSLVEDLENKLKVLSFVDSYYLIAHDETDTPHIHYVIELTCQKRLKTLLNDFEKMGYSRESVNIDKLGFLNASIKYFLHIDDDSVEEGKKLYSISQIVSNMSEYYLSLLITQDDDEINVDKLITICLDCDGNKVKIMRVLGLKTYHKWRNEISDILNYEYMLIGARAKEEERRNKEKLDSLPF